MTSEQSNEEAWRGVLMGTDPSLRRLRSFFRHLPSEPRCKMCASPFGGPAGKVLRLLWHAPMPRNPLVCRACNGDLVKRPGGAQIEVGVLFADVRGSTGLAESLSPAEFRGLLQGFYRAASGAITEHDGIVDKFLGDGVMALFLPAFAGEGFIGRAIEAGHALIAAVAESTQTRLPIGAGVHSGVAFVGVVGSEDELDFSALGDVVNVAARLGSQAAAGELLVSMAAARAAGIEVAPEEVSTVPIAGRSHPLEVLRS